jgi:hypothetical protein
VPTRARIWDVIISGEGTAIGTVRAGDEASARSLAIELAESHCRNVRVDFDPTWVQVRTKDGVGPTGQAGLLIIRAWIEDGSSAPLRAELSVTPDVSNGVTQRSMHTDVAEVQAWLREVLTGP